MTHEIESFHWCRLRLRGTLDLGGTIECDVLDRPGPIPEHFFFTEHFAPHLTTQFSYKASRNGDMIKVMDYRLINLALEGALDDLQRGYTKDAAVRLGEAADTMDEPATQKMGASKTPQTRPTLPSMKAVSPFRPQPKGDEASKSPTVGIPSSSGFHRPSEAEIARQRARFDKYSSPAR
jgi:hypothetical protein